MLSEYLPVLISVLIIFLIAFLEKRSKLVAAVTATMPIKVPLALWVVVAANPGDALAVENFSRSLVIGIIPTFGFLVAAWFGFRKGLKLVPAILIGFGVWACGVGLTFVFRSALGV